MILVSNKSPKRKPSIPLHFRNTDIPFKSSIKYLGVILDKNLTYKDHILNTCEKATRCGRALFPLLNRKSKLNGKNKLLIYKSCIRPILTYGCQVWSGRCAKTNVRKLQIIQNKNLKIILNLNRRFSTILLHSRFKMDMLNTVICKLTQRFEDRNRSSNYVVLRNLLN